MTTAPAKTVTESDSGGNLILTVNVDGTFYRIPLTQLTPDFEPVNPDDIIAGPVVFTSEMEEAFTEMERRGTCGSDIFAAQSFEDAVLLCFYRQVYGLAEGQTLRFVDANQDAIESGGNYPMVAAEEIPAAAYHWENAAAAAWRLVRQQIGQ